MKRTIGALAVLATLAALVPAGAEALSVSTAAQRTRAKMHGECRTYDRFVRVGWLFYDRGDCLSWGAHSCHHTRLWPRHHVVCTGWFHIRNRILGQHWLGRGERFCERRVDTFRLGNGVHSVPSHGRSRRGRHCWNPRLSARRRV